MNQRDDRGFTPLHRAAYLAHYDGYLEIFEYLLVRPRARSRQPAGRPLRARAARRLFIRPTGIAPAYEPFLPCPVTYARQNACNKSCVQ